MKVKDIVTIVKNSSLKNLNLDDEIIITYVNLAVIEVMSKLNLNMKTEVVKAHKYLSYYELTNEDVDQLLVVHNSEGTRLSESDVLDSKEAKFKLINYKGFLYTCDNDEDLICIYKASIYGLDNLESDVPLPAATLPAIVNYVGYLGISILGSEPNSQENAAIMYSTFVKKCEELDYQGYKINMFNESIDSRLKGFV